MAKQKPPPKESKPQEEKPKKKQKDNPLLKDKTDLSMTPMIDVTFLLLIFFMCACKFKTFEGKLAAYLPRDRGQEPFRVEKQDLPVQILLRWNAPRRQCRVSVGRVFCGYDNEGVARALHKVRQLRNAGMDRAEIEAGGDVQMLWVVQTLNMLIESGLKHIDFTAAANPLQS